MRIRTRLTLWYAGVMFASLMLMGVLSYHEFGRGPGAEGDGEDRGPRQHAGDHRRDGDPRGHDGPFGEFAAIILWCGVPAGLLALAGGWWLLRESFAPLAALTRAVERTHERNLGGQLPRSGNGDEIDRLTEVFNAMTARLDHSFQRVRDFTLNASHELKTPLTVMHGEIETAVRENGVPEAERERLLSQLDEVNRLANIVDGLSLLTKADAGQITLSLQPTRLDDIVRDAVEDAQHLAQGRTVHVTLTACEEVTVPGDRHRLRQLLLNLTDNAIKYNLPDGTVTVALRRTGNTAELTIANTGPGISPDQQSRVFDRFFRGDASHGDAVEGCGLGLSIAQWITHAHAGSIRMESEVGGLTTVTVRLPVA